MTSFEMRTPSARSASSGMLRTPRLIRALVPLVLAGGLLAGSSILARTVSLVVVALNAVSSINENGVATLTGSFTDADVAEAHSLVVDWADPNDTADSTFAVSAITAPLGVGDTFSSSTDSAVLTITGVDGVAGQVSFSVTHLYADDGLAPGNGTFSDTSTISVSVSDGDPAVTDTENVQVNNVAPTVTGVTATPPAIPGDPVALSGSIGDPGSLDAFTLEVAWGDGAVEPFSFPAGTTSFDVDHTYAGAGDFDITLTLDDDDTGQATAATSVSVSGAAPTAAPTLGGGALAVLGLLVSLGALAILRRTG